MRMRYWFIRFHVIFLRLSLFTNGTKSKAMMLIILMTGLMAGPAVCVLRITRSCFAHDTPAEQKNPCRQNCLPLSFSRCPMPRAAGGHGDGDREEIPVTIVPTNKQSTKCDWPKSHATTIGTSTVKARRPFPLLRRNATISTHFA